MRIGWIRFNMPVELSYLNGTGTLIEERTSLISELLNFGDVRIMTPLKGKIDNWVERNKEYNLNIKPIYTKCDVLIVEGGTTNMTFIDRDTKKPWIRDAMSIVGQHKGLVLWYQSDPLLPFPFMQIAERKYEWGHPKNGYCGGPKEPGWTTRSGWGTGEELWDNKKHIILIRSRDYNLVDKQYDGSRSGYGTLRGEGYISYKFMPPAINFELRENFTVKKKNLHNELVYCGGDRSRRPKFREFYCDLPKDIKVDVWGNWKKNLKSFRGPKFHGTVKHFWEIDKVLNDSLCTCQIGTTAATRMGWLTARPFEAIACKTISLADTENMGRYNYLNGGFLMDDKEDIIEKVRVLRKMDLKKRITVWKNQRERIADCTFKNLAKFMISLAEKYAE